MYHPPWPLPEDDGEPPPPLLGVRVRRPVPGAGLEGRGRAAQIVDAVELVQLVPALEERPEEEELGDEAAV